VQNGRAINPITITQGCTKGSDDATCRNNYPRGGFGMLGKVASYEGTYVYSRSIQSGP